MKTDEKVVRHVKSEHLGTARQKRKTVNYQASLGGLQKEG